MADTERALHPIFGIDHEVISVEIVPHPNPMNSLMRTARCIVLMKRYDDESQTLKFTFDMARSTMTNSDIEMSCEAMAFQAVSESLEDVLAKQENPDGYLVTE